MSFPNWRGFIYPDDDFGIDEMVAMFGPEAVCASFAQGVCDERADAALRREELNAMIAGGRCEGMTALAARLNIAATTPQEVGGVSSIGYLGPRTRGVINVVDFWWATQFNNEVMVRTAETRELELDDLVVSLIDGLKRRVGFTMGIYFRGAGHSLLPVAVTSSAVGRYAVWVWDSNDPTMLGRLDIDIASGAWTYRGNSPFSEETWRGGMGDIDLTPMDVRDAPADGNFSGRGIGKVRVSAVALGGRLNSVTVTDDDGRRIGIVDGVVVSEMPDGVVQIHRDGAGVGVTVLVPVEVATFSVDVSAPTGETGKAALVTIATRSGRVHQVESRANLGNGAARIDVGREGSAATVRPGVGSSAIVKIGDDRLAVEIPVREGESLTTRPDGTGVRLGLARGGAVLLDESVFPSADITRKVTFAPAYGARNVTEVAPKVVGEVIVPGLQQTTTSAATVVSGAPDAGSLQGAETSTTIPSAQLPPTSTAVTPTPPQSTSTTLPKSPTKSVTSTTSSTTSTSAPKSSTTLVFRFPTLSTIGPKIPYPTTTVLKFIMPTTTVKK